MGFIITHSSIEGDNAGEKLEKLETPRVYGTSDEEREAIRSGKGGQRTHFKLYDDDGILYFTGYYYGDPDSEEAFQPLDWAQYDSGCTSIKYRNADGTYSTL